jgi:8-oxo-dGTP diphosphatase
MPHIHEKIDYAADVYIVNDGAVLLRFHEKHAMWCAPGGHIELNEGPAEAALREAKEETGLDVILLGETAPDYPDGERELLVPRYLNRHPVSDTHEHISFMYFGTSASRELDPAEGEARDNLKWFTPEDLDDPACEVHPRIIAYAKAALEAARK